MQPVNKTKGDDYTDKPIKGCAKTRRRKDRRRKKVALQQQDYQCSDAGCSMLFSDDRPFDDVTCSWCGHDDPYEVTLPSATSDDEFYTW